MRRKTALLCFLLILAAGTAPAAEKLPDTMDRTFGAGADKSIVYNPPIIGALTPGSPTYDRIYEPGKAAPTCGLDVVDSANDGTYYDTFCMQVDDNQPIELIMDEAGTTIMDPVMTLYCAEFDPQNPAANVIAYDDDSGAGTLSAFTKDMGIVLQEGHQYWLVVTSYGAGMTGDYVIHPSGNVYDCNSVADVPLSWGSLKGMYR